MGKINLIEEKEQNNDGTTRGVNNGGNYYQPFRKYKIKLKNKTLYLEIDDRGCGDFGKREYITLSDKAGKIIFERQIDYVNRVPSEYYYNSWEYPALLKYLHEKGYIILDCREIEVGAWESWYYKENRKERRRIDWLLNIK